MRRWVTMLAGSLAAGGVLVAQSTFGTILGTVKDPQGGVIPSVKITVTHEGRGVSKEALTDERGAYAVTHLVPGPYSVAAESQGFQRYVREGLNLETSQILRIEILMAVGQVTETLNVAAQAPLVETETGVVSDVRSGRQMRELPLNFVRGDAFGGGIFKYMSLSPGSFRYEGASSHSFGGSRSFQNNFVLDGTTLGEQGGGQITPMQPSFESVQEMKLNMVTNSAEFGNVATVTVTTKSGTNEMHGSGFWQYSSGSLNARNFFQSTVPFRVYNQFGGSAGGPVRLPGYDGRNRTFFFGAFEGNRDHRQRVFNSSVPSLALRQGDFSQATDRQGRLLTIRDPSTGQPFAGNVIPRAQLNAVSLRAQERFYLPPNFGPPDLLNQNLRATVSNAPSWNHFDARIDHRFNDRNSIYGRYTWRNMPTPVPEGDLPNTGLRDQLRKIRNLSVVDTHVVSANLVNEVRFGIARHENPRQGPLRGLPIVQELGIRGLTNREDIRGVPNITITGFSSVTQIDFNSGPLHLFYDFHDVLTLVRNRHSIKVGFNFRWQQLQNQPIPITIFGRYDFTGAFTGFSYSDFLLGIPQQTRRTTPQQRVDGRNQFYAGFIQDDFKIHPNLTLNFGLRYEYMNPYAEVTGRMFNFDPLSGSVVVPDENVLRNQVSPIFPANIRVVTAQQAGLPVRGLRGADGNNLDPRFGLAWRPFGHARSVVRAGFGFYHNSLSSSTFSSLSGGGPFTSNEFFTNQIVNGRPLFQFPEPFLRAGSAGTQDITGVTANLFNPYTMQWNLTVEQELLATALRVSYLGTRSVNLLYRRNANQPAASTVAFHNDRRPFPQFRNVNYVSNGGSSMYHALQVEAERKLAKGLYYQVGWTWAKQLSHGIDAGEQGATIENAFNRGAEWGDDLYMSRHRLVASYIWELPFGPGRKWLGNVHGVVAQIAGGWRIAGVTLFQTGQRFTPTFAGRDPSNTNTVGGRPDRMGNGNLPKEQRRLDRWFDATAFGVPPVNAGRFGTSGIGVLEGPGTNNFDLGLFKYFRLRESARLEFSLSTTNTFNHPNFRNPSANISAPTSVGRISSLQGQDESGPRTVVLGLRIEY